MAVIAGQEMAITNQAMATASETADLVMADTGDLSTTDFEICQKLTKTHQVWPQLRIQPPWQIQGTCLLLKSVKN